MRLLEDVCRMAYMSFRSLETCLCLAKSRDDYRGHVQNPLS
ncbi:hypothetical protein HNP00_002476 [Arthrobacter sp. AZCC_0090]|nr:hypothetical protein [Arthrobacter sp. AZCC_0090]